MKVLFDYLKFSRWCNYPENVMKENFPFKMKNVFFFIFF